MDVQEVFKYINELILTKTGEQLDSLQVAILKGVLNRLKYKDIAEEYNCTPGHVKDKAYLLWRILSKTLGEDVNRANLRAVLEKNFIKNQPIKFRLCSCLNRRSFEKKVFEERNSENLELVCGGNRKIFYFKSQNEIDIENARRKAKLEILPRLAQTGLTETQIAKVLDLTLEEVQQFMP
ncbi:MAG: hypothetical protein ACM37W_04690 [Actinomycetota bacterium]